MTHTINKNNIIKINIHYNTLTNSILLTKTIKNKEIMSNKEFLFKKLELGYIKNKDGKTTNPTLYVHSYLNLETNEVTDIKYVVESFYDFKEAYGKYKGEFSCYKKALEKYHWLFDEYDCSGKIRDRKK